MTRSDRHAPANIAGWIVAAMVAVVATCAVTFMVTNRPSPSPALTRADTNDGLRPLIAAPPQLDTAQARSDAAFRTARESAGEAQNVQAAAETAAASAQQSAQDAGAVEPAVPPPLPMDWDLRPSTGAPQ